MRLNQTKSSKLNGGGRAKVVEKPRPTNFLKAMKRYKLESGDLESEQEAMKFLRDEFLVDMQQNMLTKGENEDPNKTTKRTDNVDSYLIQIFTRLELVRLTY